MNRRLALFPIVVVAVLSLVFVACAPPPPAAPALTDPKEILAKGVTSLAEVKTFEFTGSFTGLVKVPQMGDFDLSTVKMAGAIDVGNRNLKFSLDAPTILGTKIDALVVDNVAYYRISGMLGNLAGGTPGKYTRTDVPAPTSSSDPVAAATDITKAVAGLQAALAKLPSPPTKAADETCGDQDCYHVTIKLSAADLRAIDSTVSLDGDLGFDVWTRKSDNRPAKLSFSVASVEMGTFGMVLDVKYDIAVSVAAPPADEIAP
ncbi:MAG TPA: hypothetical protein VM427_08745 [Patescibacteria group bacterium]|nr:hypothetical protein [Patescibacteria group bacterium]